jgi:hypothetical protein
MASVVVNGDTSGSVTLSAPAVAGTVTVTLPSTSGTMAVLPTATGVLTEAAGGTGTTTGYYGFKSRIINGGMTIDQRNAGASVTPANSQYLVDRFFYGSTQASKFTAQQTPSATETGYATRVGAGFTNYLAFTTASAVSIGAGDYFYFAQPIEGLNVADLGWGTSTAKTITVSFLVYSSLTGTFGGSLCNGTGARSYPFSYTISSANTWTQISITVLGDTSGTWATNNGTGIYLRFGLGVGSTYSSTAGSWAAGNYISSTSAVSVVGTSSATFYITGVQLEKGSTATSFDYRPYGTELQLCQRYAQRWGGSYAYETVSNGYWTTATSASLQVPLKTTMRTQPSLTTSGTWGLILAAGGVYTITAFALDTAVTSSQTAFINVTTLSGGVAGQGTAIVSSNSTATSFVLSAEL